jgi:formamidopyrimidine-DNA glycosylase
MPELPEVETVARQLAPRISGRTIRRFSILDPLLRDGPVPVLRDRTIAGVSRSGKRVLIEFSPRPRGGAPLWLAVHLRMTGRLIRVDEGVRVDRAHLRARFRLDRGSLLFVDTRRFGTFAWYASPDAATPDGVEPLSPELTPRALERLLAGSHQNIKTWLLRQDRLVGLGNIYVSEILHASRISPFREAGSLERDEIRRMHGALRRILRRAIESCGTTFSDFQDARGVEGSYQQFLSVYAREDESCRRCREPIRRCVQQQRSTFYCSGCQV